MSTVPCHTPGGIPKWSNSFSWLQGNVLPPQVIPTVFPCAAHWLKFHSWPRANSHYYWESITLLLEAVPSVISPGEIRFVKPSYGRFLENVSIFMLICSSCPAHPWLMKEQTSWFLKKVFFSLISTSSRISRVRSQIANPLNL